MVKARHTEQYTIRAYAVDQSKKISVPALAQLMHETAMQHVLDLKLSVWDLEPLHLAWVLTNIHIDIYRRPLLNEKITIRTNPSGFERVRTYRDYRVYDEQDQLIASAVSTWFLMDTKSRRLARVPDEVRATVEGAIQQIDEFLPRTKAPKIEDTSSGYARQFQVNYHDLDFNMHLNNIYYAKWLLDALPLDFLKHHELRSLNLTYKLECLLDDLVISQAATSGESSFGHRLVKDGKEVAVGASTWVRG